MAESLSEVSLSEMSASIAKLSLQVSSCRNSGEGVCKVCPTLLRLFCETCGSGKSGDNSVSAKIRRYMDCSLPVSVEGRRYTIVSYNYTVMGPMLSRVPGHMRVELLDAAGRSMLNCAPNEIEFLEGDRL